MKTKTKTRSRLILCATLLWCFISLNTYAQSALQLSDFHGTWTGGNDATSVSITLTQKWGCTFNVNGSPLDAGNSIVAYRLPQYSPKALVDNGPPSASEVIIKFYTQNAMTGVRAPANSSNNAVSLTENNMIEQIYTGLAVISTNASGQFEMTLYMDVNNFSSVAPSVNPSAGAIPYCTLVKQ